MLAGRRVLVVEDEFLNAMVLEDLILEAGGEVVGPVRSNRDALDLIGRAPIDLALIDVNVADGDTVPTYRMLRDNGVPTMVCTGGMVPLEMRREGFDGPVCAKPVAPADIVRGLVGILEAEPLAEPEFAPASPGMCG
jgi:CheY-like chemotaxis protein